MTKQTLNGIWNYRIGKGKQTSVCVPFSASPVGHSECARSFDLEYSGKQVFLKFDGITYQASVHLNGAELGQMLPYSEYIFDVTDLVRERDNQLTVEIEDLSPPFGPTEGWENFGGIIRDVYLLYAEENYIADVTFQSTLLHDYQDACFTVKTVSARNRGSFQIALFFENTQVCCFTQDAQSGSQEQTLCGVHLWSPEQPNLYRLEVTLLDNGGPVDTCVCNVGFREFSKERHRFLLNGKPVFIKGVCKHEMYGDSGHCPTEAQMLHDMQMIKAAGCNFVRLVHYPHNKKILDIADRLGLMVSEEPGLWWSDTSDPQIHAGSLEVLRRTILRDRNHPSIVFWLCFNECEFTEQFLLDSARVCREADPTRLVSGANCMSNEETLLYYKKCGFDFYTTHPYAPTIDRGLEAARVLHDMPLLFTEWGGLFMYNNPNLIATVLTEMYDLYLTNSDEGAIAGAVFWEWSEVNDYNRGRPACIDGNLHEGLVDKYRNPNSIYYAFCQAPRHIDRVMETPMWLEAELPLPKGQNLLKQEGDRAALDCLVQTIRDADLQNEKKRRKRRLLKGPVLSGVHPLLDTPVLLQDQGIWSMDCCFCAPQITLWGLVSLTKGYPLGGTYGEGTAVLTVTYADGTQTQIPLCNGVDVTTVFGLDRSSRINPVAEHAEKFAEFGYDKNFERYILNRAQFPIDPAKTVTRLTLTSQNNGYALLFYGVTL